MLPLDVKRIKSHMRVSHNLDDEDIKEYLEFAKHDVIEAVFDSRDPLLDMEGLEKAPSFRKAVIMLTAYYYENRLAMQEVSKSGGVQESPMSVTHAIQILRAHRDRYLK